MTPVVRPSRSGVRAVVVRAVAAMLVLAAGCSVEEALPIPSCADGGSVVLAAQSVPSARQVPCFDRLPAGWAVASTTIGDRGTEIRFDSDRAGPGAAVLHYVERCDTDGAVPVPSEYPVTVRYELIEGVEPAFVGRRFHLFTGGCMWWDFDFDAGAGSALSIELGERVQLIERDELDRMIRRSFVDEEL